MEVYSNTVALAMIMDRLAIFELEEYFDEVVRNLFSTENRQKNTILDWNINEVFSWVSQLKLDVDCSEAAEVLKRECIDGYTLLRLTEDEWTNTLKLDLSLFQIIRVIFQGRANIDTSLLPPHTSETLGVTHKVMTDLRSCSPKTVETITRVDEDCAEFGIGAVYGQVTVIGCKECQVKKLDVTPIGVSNETFTMQRRKVANGVIATEILVHNLVEEGVIRPTTGPSIHFHLDPRPSQLRRKLHPSLHEDMIDDTAASQNRVAVLTYAANPVCDMFQFGRALNGGNDFVLPGVLHVDNEGCATGPVSRWACRIECERLPPFRCLIYAGGFDPLHQRIVTDTVLTPTEPNQGLDGFTTFGVRILQPEVGEWLEVSVCGNVYQPRRQLHSSPVLPVLSSLQNQLTDGTLIDMGGVCLLYHSPISMAKLPEVDPRQVVETLNALKPQCPVLFNEITFSYQDAQQRLQQARARAHDAGALSPFPTGVHVPLADYSHLRSEDNHPYIFPACGHIFSYHKSIEGRPCPLCRREGPFVPIAYSFVPAICDQFPTHVFNPCGHIASQKVCEQWAATWVPSRDLARSEQVHICPYCAGELSQSQQGNAYSRLCLQTDMDQTWPVSACTERTTTGSSILSKGIAWRDVEMETAVSVHNLHLAAPYAAVAAENPSLEQLMHSQQLLFQRENQNMWANTNSSNIKPQGYTTGTSTDINRKNFIPRRKFPKCLPKQG